MSAVTSMAGVDSSAEEAVVSWSWTDKWAQPVRAISILADQAVVSATNFLTTLIIGRTCLPEDLGLYALGMSVIFGLLNIPRSLVWTPHTNRRPRLRNDQIAAYTGSALIQTVAVALLLSGLLAAVGVCVQWTSPSLPLRKLFFTLAPVCALMILREHVRQMGLASLRLRKVLLLDFATFILQVGGLLLMAHVGALSFGRAYLVAGAACLLSFSVWQFQDRHNTAIRRRLFRLHVLQDWRLSKWVLLGSIVLAVGEGLYPWSLAFFHNPASVGVMSACLSIIALGNPLLISMTNFSGPTIAHAYSAGGIERMCRAVRLTTLALSAVILLFFAIIALWGTDIIEVLYGSKYSGQKLVALALALPLISRAALIPLGFGLLALERGDVVLRGSLVFLACTMTIGLGCVYRFGPAGVGYGSFISGLCVIFVQWTAFAAVVRERTSGGELALAIGNK